MASGKFELLEGYPADVVAISASGKIDRAAYEETLMPLIERRIEAEGKVNLLYRVGEEFEGYTAGAMWDDARLGLVHLGDFARIAVVTDVEWIRMGVKMFAPMMRGEVHLFHLSEMDAAKAWITDRRAPGQDGPRVAADRKLATGGDVA